MTPLIRRIDPADLFYFGVVLACGLALALFGDGYAWRVAGLVGLQAIAAIGFQLVFGRLGLLMLAQGAFFGIGAYALGMLSLHAGVPSPLALAGAVAAGATAAALVALPIARLESHYVALATLAFSQLALLAATHGGAWTGGSNGLYGVPPLTVGGWQAVDGPELAAVSWIGVALALAVFQGVAGGGQAARHATLREAPLVAASLGLSEARARFLLFPVAGGLAALAGGLQAQGLGVLSPAVLRFDVMVSVLAIAVVGGRGSPGGAVIAALILVPLPELFRFLESYYLVAYGAALLAVITLAPGGIDGLVRRWLPDRPSPLPSPASLVFTGGRLEAEGLAKAFGGNRAVDGVSLTLTPGQIVGLIGPNGSGKSTLLNLLSGIERADAGRVRLNETDLSGLPAPARARAGLGRSYQHPVFPAGLTLLDAVAAGADRARALAALDRVGLAGRESERVETLGPGARRFADLARTLAREPRVLLLDEPAAGMTDSERRALAELLQALAGDGLALLVVEHRMDFLMPIADRVVALAEGRVLADGGPAAVRADPQVRRHYLGAASEGTT